MSITIAPRTLLRWLVGVIAGLVLLHYAGWAVRRFTEPQGFLLQLTAWVDLDGERTLPSWTSAALLLLAALVAGDLAHRPRTVARGGRRSWTLLAAVFCYLSLDETISVHEQLNKVSSRLLGTGGVLRYGWYVIALPVALAFALVMLKWLLTLPRRTSLLVVAAGVCFVTGAVGFEVVGNALISGGRTADSFLVTTAAALEEAGEMFGASLFLCTLVAHGRRESIDESAPDPSSDGTVARHAGPDVHSPSTGPE